MKKMKWNSILIAVLYVALGIFLIVFPKTAAETLCRLVGGILVVGGVVTIVSYLMRNVSASFYRNDFVLGLIEIILGLIALLKTDMIVQLTPIVFGIIIVISGFIKMQAEIDLKRLGAKNQIPIIIMALISIVFGCILIWAPFSASVLLIFIGIGLIYSGATDLILTIWLSTKYKQYIK